MTRRFHAEGISFRYPDDCQLEREESESGWTVSVHSPGTAFAVVSYDGNMPTTEEVAETTLEALRDDYPELEATPRVDTLAGQMAVGHDINFFSLDLTNTCWTRSIYSDTGTLLVLCQVSDLDLDDYGPALRAICSSLKVEEE